MLNDLSSGGIQLVVANAVNVERSVSKDFWNEDCVPRDPNGGSGKVIYHSVLEAGARTMKPKFDKCLEEGEGGLVLIQAGELDTRGVNDTDLIVINTKVYCV